MTAPISTRYTFPWVGLLVLACAIFVSVTSEFLPTGLLPDIAAGLTVSASQVGFLVTVFAGTVVLSTTPLAALTRNFSRKSLVVVVLLIIAASGVLAAVAPTYAVLVVARVIGGLAHGLFWAVVGAYAAHLVPKHQIGRAVAITSGGGTAAFVLGVPLGTALGHALG
ncbi:MAG: MFS transporter, partial [Lacisediminihabitans sp.]